MNGLRGNKTNNHLKEEKKKNIKVSENGTLGSEHVINVASVKLEKSQSDDQCKPPQFYVLPAGGMHLAVPDLKFHCNHFDDSSTSHTTNDDLQDKRFNKSANKESNKMDFSGSSAKRESQKGSRLPFGLELTAGPGQKKPVIEGMQKRAPPPSQTLFASAALLKSYFTFSQDKDPPDKGEPTTDNEESVKNKVMGLWHNMKYGWSANLKTNFSRDSPIYLLGKIYHRTFKEQQAYEGTGFVCSNIEGFKKDFASLGWFTYRRKFPPLPESHLTTDCGWGCMIRSGQMMMVTALRRHFLPPGWRFHSISDGPQTSIHKQIMKFFCDDPSPNCPFSLHNLILSGHKMNKKAGNWYGPSCVAHMFKDAVEEGSKHISALKRIGVYIAQDGAVYVQDILDMCSLDKCVCRKPKWTSSKCYPSLPDESEELFGGDTKIKREESSSSGKSNKLYPDCDKVLENSFIDSKSQFVDVSSTASQENVPSTSSQNTVPLDLFVDLNRDMNGRGCQRTFGDAVTMRLKESPSKQVLIPDQSPCSLCHGWKSCIIFIPVRLGGTSINPIYHNCIYSLFLHDLCIGIIGGRPKHSLYFVGFQDGSLIHLDPHLSQDAVSLESADFPLSSYHCFSPRKVSISKMDPSATIGFYCHTRSQFFRLLEEAPLIAIAKDGNLDSPIFEFIDGRSKDVNGWLERTLSEEAARMSFSSTPPLNTPSEETEELVFD